MNAATPMRMPALFVGHGSPMNAITDNPYAHEWARLGRELPRPAAVLCVSAHWLTEGTAVTVGAPLKTIHDFYGFPRELYAVDYTVPDATRWAQRTAQLLRSAQVPVQESTQWGLDHGTWSVLMHLYPQRDVPVFQLSIDATQPASVHLQLGRELAALRDEGVMIVASGNIVHNLRLMRPGAPAFDWAQRFNEAVKQRLTVQDEAALTQHLDEGDAALAVNSAEHYLPLLYAAGARREGDTLRFFNDSYDLAAISMTGVLYGAA